MTSLGDRNLFHEGRTDDPSFFGNEELSKTRWETSSHLKQNFRKESSLDSGISTQALNPTVIKNKGNLSRGSKFLESYLSYIGENLELGESTTGTENCLQVLSPNIFSKKNKVKRLFIEDLIQYQNKKSRRVMYNSDSGLLCSFQEEKHSTHPLITNLDKKSSVPFHFVDIQKEIFASNLSENSTEKSPFSHVQKSPNRLFNDNRSDLKYGDSLKYRNEGVKKRNVDISLLPFNILDYESLRSHYLRHSTTSPREKCEDEHAQSENNREKNIIFIPFSEDNDIEQHKGKEILHEFIPEPKPETICLDLSRDLNMNAESLESTKDKNTKFSVKNLLKRFMNHISASIDDLESTLEKLITLGLPGRSRGYDWTTYSQIFLLQEKLSLDFKNRNAELVPPSWYGFYKSMLTAKNAILIHCNKEMLIEKEKTIKTLNLSNSNSIISAISNWAKRSNKSYFANSTRDFVPNNCSKASKEEIMLNTLDSIISSSKSVSRKEKMSLSEPVNINHLIEHGRSLFSRFIQEDSNKYKLSLLAVLPNKQTCKINIPQEIIHEERFCEKGAFWKNAKPIDIKLPGFAEFSDMPSQIQHWNKSVPVPQIDMFLQLKKQKVKKVSTPPVDMPIEELARMASNVPKRKEKDIWSSLLKDLKEFSGSDSLPDILVGDIYFQNSNKVFRFKKQALLGAIDLNYKMKDFALKERLELQHERLYGKTTKFKDINNRYMCYLGPLFLDLDFRNILKMNEKFDLIRNNDTQVLNYINMHINILDKIERKHQDNQETPLSSSETPLSTSEKCQLAPSIFGDVYISKLWKWNYESNYDNFFSVLDIEKDKGRTIDYPIPSEGWALINKTIPKPGTPESQRTPRISKHADLKPITHKSIPTNKEVSFRVGSNKWFFDNIEKSAASPKKEDMERKEDKNEEDKGNDSENKEPIPPPKLTKESEYETHTKRLPDNSFGIFEDGDNEFYGRFNHSISKRISDNGDDIDEFMKTFDKQQEPIIVNSPSISETSGALHEDHADSHEKSSPVHEISDEEIHSPISGTKEILMKFIRESLGSEECLGELEELEAHLDGIAKNESCVRIMDPIIIGETLTSKKGESPD